MLKRDELLSHLKAFRPVVAPSMLKCDFGNLHREVELLDSAGARLLHWDVMDGHFVPNLSYGPMVIERVRELNDIWRNTCEPAARRSRSTWRRCRSRFHCCARFDGEAR